MSETIPSSNERLVSERGLRVLVVFGTRPEAIKLAPVVRALQEAYGVEVVTCLTAQHREMLDQVVAFFGLPSDHDLDLMRPAQALHTLMAAALEGVGRVLAEVRPDVVVVQGDTVTAAAAALAAFYAGVPVAHVEAGLRTGDLRAPWPEEGLRRIISVVTRFHFAPTVGARENLVREGVPPERICVTGNTVVDALLRARALVREDAGLQRRLDARFDPLIEDRALVLVTGHRRESFGEGFRRICEAIRAVAARPDVAVVYPVHLNPNVRRPVAERLGAVANVHLMEPVGYPEFVYLMDRARLILTDSGGVQEEAPSFGVPVLVMRDTTERPEAVEAGVARLVGTDVGRITSEAARVLDAGGALDPNTANPFGDGRAAGRIVDVLTSALRGGSGLDARDSVAEGAGVGANATVESP